MSFLMRHDTAEASAAAGESQVASFGLDGGPEASLARLSWSPRVERPARGPAAPAGGDEDDDLIALDAHRRAPEIAGRVRARDDEARALFMSDEPRDAREDDEEGEDLDDLAAADARELEEGADSADEEGGRGRAARARARAPKADGECHA